MSLFSRPWRTVALASLCGLVAAPLVALPAQAAPDNSGVVISELYLSGGSANAVFNRKFVELYNPTAAEIDLNGMSIQQRSANVATKFNVAPLTGKIAAGGYYVASMNGNGATPVGATLPVDDQQIGLVPGGPNGTILLSSSTTALIGDKAAVLADQTIVDLVGYHTDAALPGLTFEGTSSFAPTAANTVPRSIIRTGGIDTDDNLKDFQLAQTVTPGAANVPDSEMPPVDPIDPDTAEKLTIAQIQGTGTQSPYVAQNVTTSGVVTAAYPKGGFNGYYIQTPGTGGAIDFATHKASTGLFVFSESTVASVSIGDYVEVTGTVAESFGLTQVNVVSPSNLTKLTDTVPAPVPATVAFPKTAEQREVLEGMLLDPQGPYSVTSVYETNEFGEVALVAGDKPLITPTAVGKLGSPEAAAQDARAEAERVVLDDGSDLSYLVAPNNRNLELPYLDNKNPVRVGAAVTFTSPVILDFRYGKWKFQPQVTVTGANPGDAPVEFANTRIAAPKDVGGNVKLASFNVLNYFATTGEERTGCTYYTDIFGKNVTVNNSNNEGCGVRGAATKDAFGRQEAKIVAAINALDADVVSLEEIQNSVKIGLDRDDALKTLVAALNAEAGTERWAYSASPSKVPPVAKEDVIRLAFIYNPKTVETVGEGAILIGDPAFDNAREPDAQSFKAKGDSDADNFLVIANHFKSKSGTGATGDNLDKNDGQGAYVGDRTRQAEALVKFADAQKAKAKTEKVFLVGDFNSYDYEPPLEVLKSAGYVNQGAKTGKFTYAFNGAVGSLDHIFASPAADSIVSGQDIWNINSVESIALEYSRHDYNAKNLYAADPYRSSDHDPIIVGLNTSSDTPSADTATINLMNINDFHGRINVPAEKEGPSHTVQFAGTVEGEKEKYGKDNSILLSAGDNIGASLFASSSLEDQPTIDVLNLLGLKASAVGNHEFDRGLNDLVDRVIDGGKNAKFAYLGANVYAKGTETPVLDEYKIIEVDGVRVAVIGAITQETPTLVSPDGIKSLSFGDPVDAVNRVAKKLVAEKLADVIVAEYHEGASAGTPDGATLLQEIKAGGVFAKIVTETTPAVNAIFTGHTHKQYAWQAQVPQAAEGQTRPVIQTGSYGEFIGQSVLTVDRKSMTVTDATAMNVKRVSTPTDELTAKYPVVEAVKVVVDKAIADSHLIGGRKIGAATADITRAFNGAVQDDRSKESTLGSLVADSLLDSLKSADRGGAEIGLVNPGGMRAEIKAGEITVAAANAVLPFLNNLWTTTLTGAQFTTILEQQWQRTDKGEVGSRPYLQLGMSSNVSYTFDAALPEGGRITSITVNGKPIDPKRDYVVGSFSFLLQGGDNFHEFKNGKNTKDTGLVDSDAWIQYLTDHNPVAPNFKRNSVQVSGVPTEAVKAGESFTLKLGTLDRTSTGSPKNTSVAVAFGGEAVGTSPITATGGDVTVTVPASATSGTHDVTLTGLESGTTVHLQVAVAGLPVVTTPAPESALTDELKGKIEAPATIAPGASATVKVLGATGPQKVTAWLYSEPMALTEGVVTTGDDGTFTVTVPADAPEGAHRLSVQDEQGNVLGWSAVAITAANPGTDTEGGSNSGAGTEGGSDSGAGTEGGSNAGAGTEGGSDSGTGTEGGSNSGAGTEGGSDSGAGTEGDSNSGAGTDGSGTNNGSGSGTNGSGAHGSTGANGSGDGLSSTGANVLGAGVIALLLLLAGAGVVVLRRRKTVEQD